MGYLSMKIQIFNIVGYSFLSYGLATYTNRIKYLFIQREFNAL
ncbi:hypothetical protein SPWS13_1935 [Shewanella putrefaciens]|nr:hypothetical protein SPWS13_1935 [Shewanella putrefaciens]